MPTQSTPTGNENRGQANPSAAACQPQTDGRRGFVCFPSFSKQISLSAISKMYIKYTYIFANPNCQISRSLTQGPQERTRREGPPSTLDFCVSSLCTLHSAQEEDFGKQTHTCGQPKQVGQTCFRNVTRRHRRRQGNVIRGCH